MEISVTGAAELDALAKRLRKAAQTDLIKELRTAVRAAAVPVRDAAKQNVLALPADGPHHTGLRRRVARTVRLSVRTSGRNVGARVFTRGGDPVGPRTSAAWMGRHMNKGTWRHPVYGHDVWVIQTVPPGWFDRATQGAAPRAREEIGEVLRRIREQIEG